MLAFLVVVPGRLFCTFSRGSLFFGRWCFSLMLCEAWIVKSCWILWLLFQQSICCLFGWLWGSLLYRSVASSAALSLLISRGSNGHLSDFTFDTKFNMKVNFVIRGKCYSGSDDNDIKIWITLVYSDRGDRKSDERCCTLQVHQVTVELLGFCQNCFRKSSSKTTQL